MSQPQDSTAPSPDEPAPGGSGGSGNGRKVLVGVVVVALVLIAAAAGLVAWRASDDGSTASDQPSASPSAQPSASEEAGPSPEATDPALAKYYDQRLEWHECGDNECATLQVPLDYAKPQGRAIKLAVLRVPAAEKNDRLGSIVVNPGGPGGSGIQYAAAGAFQFGQTLTRYYDIVGFDPRGVGRSTPLECIDTEELDELVSFDPDPDTAAERDELDKILNEFGQGCLDNSGALAKHISTVEAAKDIDILREALGEEKLDYLGASYGTFLGATYADLFPSRVDKMVLDGALDPSLSNRELSLQQAEGFETALRAYVQSCVDEGDCVLGDSVDAGTERLRAFYDELEEQPIPTGDADRPLTAGLAMIGTWLPLYVKGFWPQLTKALEAAIGNDDGSALLSLADMYLSRGPDRYVDNSMEVLYAVNCLDHDDYISSDKVPEHFAEFEKASPTFGRSFAFSLSTCSSWPVKTGNTTKALHAKGAAPILVIGTTRDPATPMRWAEAMASQLESGILVRRDGDGHTGFNQGNACVDGIVEDYFVEGKVPSGDVDC